jgi:hypothetical protein
MQAARMNPVPKQRSHRKGVRAAARGAVDREPPDAQMVSDGGNISGGIGHSSAAVPVRAAVAGPVVADHAGAGRADKPIVGVAVQAAAGRPVHCKHRKAARITPFGKGERAPIRRLSDLIAPVHSGNPNQRHV